MDLTGRAKAVHVLNLDCVRAAVKRTGRIADCAILWKDRGLFAIVELKGGRNAVDASLVAQQIQSGVDVVGSLVNDQHVSDFYPILMYRGPKPSRNLRHRLIEFRGQKRHIILMACGSRLTGIRGLERLG